MNRILTRRRFTKMTAATAAAVSLTRAPRAAGLLMQSPRSQAENPTVTKPEAGDPTSNVPGDPWSGHDSPELVAAALIGLPAIPPGPFDPTWDSIQHNYKDPDWFRDGKFGIMMHWGICSVPAHASEWYVRYMYGFVDVIKSWKADRFDADHLMSLYKKAGAKYYVAMGCHHDNFDMWNSKCQPRWNAANSGPKKVILCNFEKAARQL